MKAKRKPTEGEPDFDEESRPVASTGFDDLTATLDLLGVTPDQWARAHTKGDAAALLQSKGLSQGEIAELLRGVVLDDPDREREAQAKIARWASPEHKAEVEIALQPLGLSKNERAVVLVVHCDRLDTHAAIARATKLNRKTVVEIMRRGDVRDALNRLRRGETLPVSRPPVAVKRERTLPGEMKSAKWALGQYVKADHWTDSTLNLYAPEVGALVQGETASIGEKRLALIGLCPRVLQHPEHGPELLAALVETMEAARFGSKTKAAAARKALRWLTPTARGNPVGFGDKLLGQILYGLALAFAPIQRAAQGERGGAAVKVIRKTFGVELDGFTDAELLPLLKVELPATAARLAEKATSISAETYLRAWARCPDFRKRLAERLRP